MIALVRDRGEALVWDSGEAAVRDGGGGGAAEGGGEGGAEDAQGTPTQRRGEEGEEGDGGGGARPPPPPLLYPRGAPPSMPSPKNTTARPEEQRETTRPGKQGEIGSGQGRVGAGTRTVVFEGKVSFHPVRQYTLHPKPKNPNLEP